MFNICIACGQYYADKRIDPSGPFAICPECGHATRFLQLPLLVVCGASGSGKSAVCQALLGCVSEAVLLEGDLLWRAEFNKPEEKYRSFYETWLRMAKNIAQSGRPVVLFNAGAIPENIEPCVERRYFSAVHYLALVCAGEELEKRLRARPEWRQCGSAENIEKQAAFNRWFMENGAAASPPIELLDTSGKPFEQTAAEVEAWMRTVISARRVGKPQ